MTTALPHGYDLSDAERMAWRCAWQRPAGMFRPAERMDLARHAIIVALHEAGQDPGLAALLSAGVNSISAAADREIREHGWSVKTGGPMRGFHAWWGGPRPTRDEMEDRIIDPIALRQILPLLHPSHRLALRLLAEHGNNRDAAEAAGWTVHTMKNYLSNGRREFADWWYWPDPPAPLWHPGHPGGRGDGYDTRRAMRDLRRDRDRKGRAA